MLHSSTRSFFMVLVSFSRTMAKSATYSNKKATNLKLSDNLAVMLVSNFHNNFLPLAA